MNLSQELLSATKPEFSEQVVAENKLSKDVPILKLLMYYIDATTSGGEVSGEIVPFQDRLNEVKKQYPELNPEHWDNEVKARRIAEKRICELLKERGVAIERPEDLPIVVRSIIEKKYNEYNKYNE